MNTVQKIFFSLVIIAAGLSLGYCTMRSQHQKPVSKIQIQKRPDPAPLQTGVSSPTTPPAPEPPEKVPHPTHEVTFEEPYFPFLAHEDALASISVGTVTTGRQINARQLSLPGMSYDVLPRQRKRKLLYGSDQMIGLLEHAAARLFRVHQRPMWMGNIGRQGGGDIPWSVSHNSGRDADIAFCYTDPSGTPVDPPDLLHLDADGRSHVNDGYYRFDTACTWTLVEALLTHPEVQVQYIFISNPLKRKLLNYARRRATSRRTMEKAEAILGQPGGALPHNDHIHVRIYCSMRDVEGGCVNNGKIHPWVDQFQHAKQNKIREVSRHLQHAEAEERARAVERLTVLRAKSETRRVQKMLEDNSPRVRGAAVLALGKLGGKSVSKILAGHFRREEDPGVQIKTIRAMSSFGGAPFGELLARVIEDPLFDTRTSGRLSKALRVAYSPEEPRTEPLDPEAEPIPSEMQAVSAHKHSGTVLPDLQNRSMSVRLAAIEAAASSERPEPVPALIGALTHEDPMIRGRASRALHRLTNHNFGVRWDDPELGEETIHRGLETWRVWLSRFGNKSRNIWISSGFQSSAYPVRKLDRKSIWSIAQAIPAPDHLSYNAQKSLMRITNHHPQSLHWSKGDACWHWTRWLNKNRKKLRISPSPPELESCNR